jgi:clan AA aspartic protease (TIGR02281 family)
MRKLVSMAAFAAALLDSTAPAAHAETKWGKVAGWEISIDNSNGGCFAVQGFADGSIIRIGFKPDVEAINLYFANGRWPAGMAGRSYDVRFVFDGTSSYDGRMLAINASGTISLLHENVSAEFAYDFARRSNLQIFNRIDGRRIANLSLDNTFAAMTEVINCQKAMNIRQSVDDKPPPAPPPVATGPWIIALSEGDGGGHTAIGKVNGVPLTWIVDTGATISSIPLEIAERLGASEVRKMQFRMADGRVRTESIVLIDKLSVGGKVVVNNVEVAVGPRGSAPLLGKNLLDRFGSYEVDNKSGNLTLRK